jgi:hypothetical protein
VNHEYDFIVILGDCDSGYKVVNNVCEECGYDQFQPLKNRPTCNACPTGYITFQVTTAIASSECKGKEQF